MTKKQQRELAWEVNQIKLDVKALLDIIKEEHTVESKLDLTEVVQVSTLYHCDELLAMIDAA